MVDMKYHLHPACEALPKLPAKAYADLCASIKAIGLLQPILLSEDDLVLDGKNRMYACEAANRPLRVERVKLNGKSAVEFVLEVNRHRLRKNSQLALAGSRLATASDGRPNKFESNQLSIEQAARALGISVMAIKRARAVEQHGVPELLTYLECGEVSLTAAEAVARADADTQLQACAVDAKAVRKLASDLHAKARQGGTIEDSSTHLTHILRVFRAMNPSAREYALTMAIDALNTELAAVRKGAA